MLGVWSISGVKADAKEILKQTYTDENGKAYRNYWYNFLFGLIMVLATSALISIITAIIPGAGTLAVTIFFANPLTVSYGLFVLWQARGIIRIKDAFLFPTENGNYLPIVAATGMMTLFIFLWSLLFVIPGIIKAYAYRMVPFLLAENPNLDWKRALELSKQMTAGEKGNMFFLDLSFIGYFLLCAITCGLGTFFLLPYYQTTMCEVYLHLREKAINEGTLSAEDLGKETLYSIEA